MARQDIDGAPSPNHPPVIPDRPGPGPGPGTGTDNYLAHSASNLSICRPPESGKRRLLLIYVHGFNGSEASFHAFPAHVHSLLTDALAESHEVYTRIYPRYKSRGDMNIARDQFSNWLSPHEADDLDIILLGHSLGGILTANVALLPSSPSHPHQHRKHHILGLINFDVPFLGLHPGIIQTSCKSLFHRDRDRDQIPAGHETETFTETETQTTAEAIAAFSPHYDPPFFNDIRWAERSGMQGVVHFFEKNYNRLAKSILTRIVSPYEFAGCLNNYPTLRRQYKQLMEMEAAHDQASRIRFVNYYTASDCPETVQEKDPTALKETDVGENEHSPRASMGHSSSPVGSEENTLCTEEPSENKPGPEPCSLTPTTSQSESKPRPDPDPDQSDCICASETTDCTSKQHKNKKRRKFVLLPSHHWSHGDDSLWIPVNMDNMNEITAHQSLFLPHGRNYDQLVGDTMATIEQWIQADLTQRMLSQEEQEGGVDPI